MHLDYSGELLSIKERHECAMAAAMADRMVQITLRKSAHLFFLPADVI